VVHAAAMSEDDEFHFKALILGDSAIGKTCLLDSLLEANTVDWNDPHFVPTSQCSFEKIFSYQVKGATELYKGEFWDTAGLEAMRALRLVAFKDADVTVIAYDMTRPSSLQNVSNDGASWYKEVIEYGNKKTAIVLVGTKFDLWKPSHEAGDAGLTSHREAQEVAHEIGACALIYTSAKTGYGVCTEKDTMQSLPCTLKDKVLEIASVSADFGQTLPRLAMPVFESDELKVAASAPSSDEFVISPDRAEDTERRETDDIDEIEPPSKTNSSQDNGCACKCIVM